MGKAFVIISIGDTSNGAKKASIRPLGEQNGRPRILHLEQFQQFGASGIELDEKGEVLDNTSGYMLTGEKPLKDWQSGDIVEEAFYPAKLDK